MSLPFPAKLKLLISTRNMSQSEVEVACGLPKSRIAKWAKHGKPSTSQLKELGRVLRCPPDWLADDEADWPPPKYDYSAQTHHDDRTSLVDDPDDESDYLLSVPESIIEPHQEEMVSKRISRIATLISLVNEEITNLDKLIARTKGPLLLKDGRRIVRLKDGKYRIVGSPGSSREQYRPNRDRPAASDSVTTTGSDSDDPFEGR